MFYSNTDLYYKCLLAGLLRSEWMDYHEIWERMKLETSSLLITGINTHNCSLNYASEPQK